MNARIKKKIDKRFGYKSYSRARYHAVINIIKSDLHNVRRGYIAFRLVPHATWYNHGNHYNKRNINLHIELFEYPMTPYLDILRIDVSVKGLKIRILNPEVR